MHAPPTVMQTLMLGAWFGLVTGVGAVGLWMLKAFVLDRITLISPHVVWTSPLTFLVLGVALAALLSLAERALRRTLPLHLLMLLFTALGGACGLLIWSTELNDIAVMVLALGIAVQAGAIARTNPAFTLRWTRRTLPVLGAMVVATTLGLTAGGRIIERRAIASLPAPATGASPPNVLLLILDTVRAANLSLYGYARSTTPHLERIARRGITFDRAIAGSPWTLPSHAVMFTGHEAHELSADWEERLDDAAPTIAEHLRSHGYATGGFAGNFFYGNSEWGLARGFVHYEDYVPSFGHAMLSTFPGHWLVKRMESAQLDRRFWFHRLNGRRIAPDVSRSVVRWLERVRHSKHPWFAFVNYYDAHDPYVAPPGRTEPMTSLPMHDAIPVRRRTADGLRDADSAARRRTLDRIDRYDAAITYLDSQLGALLTDLDERGLLANTVVMIASDHGEEFMEAGYGWHGESLRMTSLHVPLVIIPPGGTRAVRVDDPVSLRDIAATIADLTGTAADAPVPGQSLARYWAGPRPPDPEPVLSSVRLRTPRRFTGDSTVFSLVDSAMHYLRTDRGNEFLFAFEDDPFEQRDLGGETAAGLDAYRSRLQRRLAPDERSLGQDRRNHNGGASAGARDSAGRGGRSLR
jgi:arylsulfatase A-like enzyme